MPTLSNDQKTHNQCRERPPASHLSVLDATDCGRNAVVYEAASELNHSKNRVNGWFGCHSRCSMAGGLLVQRKICKGIARPTKLENSQ
jgi:hypothetical protein